MEVPCKTTKRDSGLEDLDHCIGEDSEAELHLIENTDLEEYQRCCAVNEAAQLTEVKATAGVRVSPRMTE